MGYAEAITFRELYFAARECANGVRWKESVQDFLRSHLKRTLSLARDLRSDRYKISPYVRFVVTEPKKREIVSTRFRDRVFQRAMCNNGLYRDMTRSFIYDSGACQNGRGTDFSRNRLKMHLNRFRRKHGTDGWVLKLDVKNFFASIPHRIAKAAVAKRVKDPGFVRRIFEVIDSFADSPPPGEEPRGIALGSQISQLIALAVLDDFDHAIKERFRIRHYVRYMDDMVLIHEDREKLMECWRFAEEHFSSIGLTINPKSTLLRLQQGFSFLNRRHFFTASGRLIVKVAHKSISRERRRLRSIHTLWMRGKLSDRDVIEHFTAWKATATKADSHGLIRAMTKYAKSLFNKENQNARIQDKKPE